MLVHDIDPIGMHKVTLNGESAADEKEAKQTKLKLSAFGGKLRSDSLAFVLKKESRSLSNAMVSLYCER
jgi:hypothetical protein